MVVRALPAVVDRPRCAADPVPEESVGEPARALGDVAPPQAPVAPDDALAVAGDLGDRLVQRRDADGRGSATTGVRAGQGGPTSR